MSTANNPSRNNHFAREPKSKPNPLYIRIARFIIDNAEAGHPVTRKDVVNQFKLDGYKDFNAQIELLAQKNQELYSKVKPLILK